MTQKANSNSSNRNNYLNGVMGVVVGDALGCPVQFKSRAEVDANPVKTMQGFGTFNLPAGSWTDDSSLTLAMLASIKECGKADVDDIAKHFVDWLHNGAYTPYGYSFDIGRTCDIGIENYNHSGDTATCGLSSEHDNGNGSLMRTMPICIYAYENVTSGKITESEAIDLIHDVSGLTHAHLRSKMACGLYYFMVKNLVLDSVNITSNSDDSNMVDITQNPNIMTCLQAGMNEGRAFYENRANDEDRTDGEAYNRELQYFSRMFDLGTFRETPRDAIKSSGYVVDSIEAAVWSLITTDDFESALLKAVNLADDSDTVGAIAGGLAGLYYGYEAIRKDWLDEIKRREWIEELCHKNTEM